MSNFFTPIQSHLYLFYYLFISLFAGLLILLFVDMPSCILYVHNFYLRLSQIFLV